MYENLLLHGEKRFVVCSQPVLTVLVLIHKGLEMFISLRGSVYTIAVVTIAALVTSDFGVSGFRELSSVEERQLVGAGVFTSNQCDIVPGFDCVNGIVMGAACNQAGIDGVECITAKTPQQCKAKVGVFDECTVTLVRNCPNGIIVKCVGGVWVNKNAGNAACGLWDDC